MSILLSCSSLGLDKLLECEVKAYTIALFFQIRNAEHVKLEFNDDDKAKA